MKIPPLPFGAAISLLCVLSLARGSSADDRAILEEVHKVTGGRTWTNQWDLNDPMCTWYGITCDGNDADNGPVSDIVLDNNRLSGALPDEIWSLPGLRYFSAIKNDLYDGGFTGFIENSNQHAVQVIDLSENIIADIEGIQNAPYSLRFLYLTSNMIDGEDPLLLISRLPNIRKVYLNDNLLSGEIPTEIGKLTLLKELYVYDNLLTGTIPTEIGLLKKLEIITLAENTMYGKIPEEVNQLLNIKTFSVHNNDLTSGELSGPIPSFRNSPNIIELRLEGNDFTGSIPRDLFLIAETSHEMTVMLDNNQLIGGVPSELGRFPDLFLGIAGNKISKVPEELCRINKWMNGNVGLYGCDAIACSSGSFNSKSGKQDTDSDKCEDCLSKFGSNSGTLGNVGSYTCKDYGDVDRNDDDDVFFDDDGYLDTVGDDDGDEGFADDGFGVVDGDDEIDLDAYGKTADEHLSQELTALTSFYMNSDPTNWENYAGWENLYSVGDDDEYYNILIDSGINHCSYYGITCDENNRTTEIELPYNGLKGEIHPSLFELEKLKMLDLSYNRVWFKEDSSSHGFQGLRNAENLEQLHMSGTATTKFTGISGGTKLKHLYLDNLLMEENLTDDIYLLTKLEYFSAKSSDIHGSLTSEVSQLENLISMNLYSNQLDGELPTELGLLNNLEALELSENKFTGSIPTELQKLPELQEISIHHRLSPGKGLTGPLPAFNECPKLKFVSFESNMLEGNIPSNFLAGIESENDEIFIGLSDNKLVGTMPNSLLKYKNIVIDVVGNEISEMYDFCDPDSEQDADSILLWMNEEVKNQKTKNPDESVCNAIMCPPKYYSALGLSSYDIICEDCDSNEYYGSKTCGEGPLTIAVDIERDILTDLYFATGGRYWHNSLNWDDPKVDVCNLHGISCDGGEIITRIELKNNGLVGEIPSSVWELDGLLVLDLTNNAVDVSFEDIQTERPLKKLILKGTPIMSLGIITAAASKLSNLESLDVGNCTIYDFFDDVYDLSRLDKLKHLNMDDNQFNDWMSSSIMNLKNLETLSCENCALYGFIPEELGDFQSLRHLNLAENELTGGLINFRENTKLHKLYLANNQLSGTLPYDFLAGLDNDDATIVDLASNKLTGTFPRSLLDMDSLFIALEGNAFESLPSDCDSRGKWMDGLVGEMNKKSLNGCDAILCHNNSHTDLGRAYMNDDDNFIACKPCRISHSNYLGSTKCTKSHSASSDYDALDMLYTNLNGNNWIDQNHWLSPLPVCKWYGVSCDNDLSVVSIKLSNNNMFGNVTGAVFSSIPSLRTFDISGNDVNFRFNKIVQNVKLEVLDITSTATSSLSGIDELLGLQKLYAGGNNMIGTFPRDLIALTNLKVLEISFNSFAGSLNGDRLKKLTELEQVYASNNEFVGTIPSEFGSLSKLQKLDLAENKLSGIIPVTLDMLTDMTRLSLQGQKSPGGLQGPLPSFSNLSLERLELQNNKLQGTIPNDLLGKSTKKNNEVEINLSHNELTGTVPEDLQKFKQLSLYITGNRLLDLTDSFCDSIPVRWMGGGVKTYGCKALGCPVKTYNDLGRVSEDETLCKPCKNNLYFGSTVCPPSYADERKILEAIYQKTKGDLWSRENTWMDKKSICNWEGVVCDGYLGPDEGGVTTINLEDFGLDGDIPSVVFALPYLKELNLKNNLIKISFDNIDSAKFLETLNLSHTGLESITGLSNAKGLKTLHLSENKLSGKLSESGLLDLPELEYLFIPYNDFSGSIPRDIGKMKKLTHFYAYDNMIEGTIPSEIGELQMLETIVLSENQISGQLPSEIGSLLNLELFAVYRKKKPGPKLDGTLPAFDRSVSLETLYLDYNDITGPIPNNFLAASNGPIEVSFRNNKLTGTIPMSLSHIDELFIELEDNMIENMDGTFCNKNQWMDGLVRNYNCNAILCFPGFANTNGRATHETPLCRPCPIAKNAPYFGSTSCDAVLDERDILINLYMNCAGGAWTEQDGWLSGEHVCTWFGITCDKNKNVKTIILSNNNLTGRPEKELFQMRYLEELCFHQNDKIDFSFDGILHARALTILHLGQTGLSSIEGIEMASSLQLIQLNGNPLSGTFPQQLLELSNIKTIDIRGCKLAGTVPASFEKLEYLVKIDAGYNQFTGRVPSFDKNWRLQTIDLSNNLFDLPIPENFLDGPPHYMPLAVNLSHNKIPGGIPTHLDRLDSLNLDITDNEILHIPDTLCDSDNFGWENGKVKDYSCSAILCPPRTTNPNGRQDSDENPCVECKYGSMYW
eukprot:CAMPEP_0198253496 /NCGR_PEP_ID=MMETSP1447-20131203/3899_1 /TAXON_ID=420782 /ORGANISM="Chaetoceros dichaeta, Strain CCMP1751" /LENGTH=2259 /DNA_ID=CAMNT_0043939185 /DNA_START=169 /DNA_END=6945 /DNA_ORIENTATION=+